MNVLSFVFDFLIFSCHTHALFLIWVHIGTSFRNRLPNGENAIFLEQTSLNLKSHADIDVQYRPKKIDLPFVTDTFYSKQKPFIIKTFKAKLSDLYKLKLMQIFLIQSNMTSKVHNHITCVTINYIFGHFVTRNQRFFSCFTCMFILWNFLSS